MARDLEFQSLHVSENRGDGIPSWKMMRRIAMGFNRKGFGCIRVTIQSFKTEIPAK